jgi:hypothetical protein
VLQVARPLRGAEIELRTSNGCAAWGGLSSMFNVRSSKFDVQPAAGAVALQLRSAKEKARDFSRAFPSDILTGFRRVS